MSSDIVITKRINKIDHESRNFLLIGVIIAKSDPKFFESSSMRSEKDSDTARGVITLTVRDSERDTINCTIWGSQVMIESYDSLFHIGDVVNIIKPKVLPSCHDRAEQFNPTTTSMFSLSLGEQEDCKIKLHEGSGIESMKKLVFVPTVPASETYSLADIAAGGQNINGQSLNILVAVRSVRPKKQIVVAKTGKLKYLREVILMDASHAGMSMKFWSNELIVRIDKWIPLTTILLIKDVRVEFDQYYKTVCLGMSGRTIITEDPAIEEADKLLVYVTKLSSVQDLDITCSLLSNTTDLATITSVMTVKQILDRAEGDLKTEEEQFTVLCYAVLTKFDLDGCTRIIGRKCFSCKTFLRISDSKCQREECQYNPPNVSVFFDIPVDITDHTGTLSNCSLMNQAAENTLKCKVESFLKMGDSQKGKLKWRFLLERCSLKLIVKRKSPIRFQTLYSIVECTVASPREVESKIKVY
ncbi:meiosis-specific with OB domain-containing protein [Malaya genurostris]|uniref:meiosis-specific with OB domain-containing protein n=1 Tax=Malaya genurostris TaxID=325434 RepID=UPI0026F386D3|nr:meiosis-specific with OB domain-containing protein [Malaya genurostris]